MDTAEMRYEIVVNNKSNNAAIDLNDECTSSILNGDLIISLALSNNLINVFVKNKGSKPVALNRLSFELFSSQSYEEAFCITNPKKISEKINYTSMNKLNSDEKIESQLFEIFVDEENHNSKIFGFLGCKYSKNFIKNVVKNNELKISAVYDFINQEVIPGEELVLDSLYIKEGRNIFSLFNSFADRMTAGIKACNKRPVFNKPNTYSILFTYRANSNTLKVEGKPVFIKVNGKKLYAVDISKPEGKKQVFVNANAVLSRASDLDLRAVGEYINVVEANKLFNANYELTELLDYLKAAFEGVRFYSDDCPVGLADEYITFESSELVFEDKMHLLDYIGMRKNSHHINYDFFIKLLMRRVVSTCKDSFSVNSPKINELVSVILGSANIGSIKNEELLEMARDIDNEYAIIPFIDRKKAFALLIRGRKYMYVAVFNLEKEPVKFYCDLTVHSGYSELDGVAVETYSNTNYLISEGKLYIRSLPSMDCCLFKKSIAIQAVAVDNDAV